MEAIDGGDTTELVAIHDVGTDIWLLDVSDRAVAVEPDVLRKLGNPALVCFGGHDERPCVVDGAPGAADGHGVVLEVVSSRAADAAFVRRFRRLMAAEAPVRVLHRAAGSSRWPVAGSRYSGLSPQLTARLTDDR